MENIITKAVDTIAEKTKAANTAAVETSGKLLNRVFKAGDRAQDLMAEALETSIAFYGIQQDRLLTRLEKAKNEYVGEDKGLLDLLPFRGKTLTEISEDVMEEATETVEVVKKKATKKAKAAKKAVAELAEDALETAEEVLDKAEEVFDQVEDAIEDKIEDAVETVAKAKKTAKKAVKAATEKSNLKAIKGIGPKMEGLLNEAGIYNFEQLASAKKKDLQAILDAAGPRYKSFDPSDWAKQAKAILKG